MRSGPDSITWEVKREVKAVQIGAVPPCSNWRIP